MQTIIESAVKALEGVSPGNLTTDQLNGSIQVLESLDVNDAIDQYWNNLPEKPEKDKDLQAWEKKVHQLGKELNHQLHGLNDELSRVKDIRNNLSLPALDPLIKAAQEIIRPLYNFTAQLTA